MLPAKEIHKENGMIRPGTSDPQALARMGSAKEGTPTCIALLSSPHASERTPGSKEQAARSTREAPRPNAEGTELDRARDRPHGAGHSAPGTGLRRPLTASRPPPPINTRGLAFLPVRQHLSRVAIG